MVEHRSVKMELDIGGYGGLGIKGVDRIAM